MEKPSISDFFYVRILVKMLFPMNDDLYLEGVNHI